MTNQDEAKWDSGNKEAQIEILNKMLVPHMKVLKQSSKSKLLRRAQGAVQIIEELLDAYS